MHRRILLSLPIAFAIGAVPALPCSIVAPVPGAEIRADLAVAGTVTAVDRPVTVDGTEVRTFTFRVDTVLRGARRTAVRVQTSANSASCGADFAVGRRYLLFASRAEGEGGAFTKGAFITSLADPNRRLPRTERVTEDDLFVPAPDEFDAKRSNLTPREFVAYTPFTAYWLGGYTGYGTIRTLREDAGAVVAAYRQGRSAPLRVGTRRVCLAATTEGIPPLTGLRRIRGVPAGFRQGGLSVFTGQVEVRITGRTRKDQIQAAQQIFTGGAQTFGDALPAPAARPVNRLSPCPAP